MNNPSELRKETTMALNEEIIRNLYEVAEKEPKTFRSLFTENGYWWDVPAGVKYHGDDIARAADIYSVAFPDMHRELSRLYIDGDVVIVELTLNGTHQGDLPIGLGTIPATNKEFHILCIDVFHLEDGKVSAFDCHYAGTIMLGQLGVLGNLEASLKK
jgi:predicted ester cyclase